MRKLNYLWVVMLIAFAANSFGITCNWQDGTKADPNWTEATNWDNVPMEGDTVNIKTADPNDDPVLGSGINGEGGILLMGNGTTDNLTVTGGTLTISGTTGLCKLGDGANSNVTVDISSGAISIDAGDILMPNNSGTFTLNMTGGTFENINADQNMKASMNVAGSSFFNISGGTFHSARELWLGDNGPSTVNQTGGTVSADMKLVMDRRDQNNDTVYNLKGGTLSAPNILFKGNGKLNIAGGSFIYPTTLQGDIDDEISEGRIVTTGLRKFVIQDDTPEAGKTTLTAPINPVPEDGAEGLLNPVLLEWEDVVGSYDVYYGYDEAEVTASTTPNTTVTDPNYLIPDTLDDGATVFWKIGEAGDVRSFSMANVIATAPSPADGAVDVPHTVLLEWMPGIDSVSSDVYYGADEAAVATATTPDATVIDPNYLLIDDPNLVNGAEYFWRVDEYDGETTHTGNIWSFTFLCDGSVNPVADLNTNCKVDLDDFQLMAMDWLEVAPTESLWDFDMSTDPVGPELMQLDVRGTQDAYDMSGDGKLLLTGGTQGLNLDTKDDIVTSFCDTNVHYVVKSTSIPEETANCARLWYSMGLSQSPGQLGLVGVSIYMVAGNPDTQTVEIWRGVPPFHADYDDSEPIILSGFAADTFVDITIDYDYETDTYDYVVTDGTLTESGTDVSYSAFAEGDGGGFTINNPFSGVTAEIDSLSLLRKGSIVELLGDIAPVNVGGDGTVDLIDLAELANEWLVAP